MRLLHIVAGISGMVFGIVALAASKGGWLHRRSGMVFIGSMLAMAGTGTLLALLRQPAPGNVPTGLLTLYLVATGAAAARPPSDATRRLDSVAVLAVLSIAVLEIVFGLIRRDAPDTSGAYPRPVYFIMAAVSFALADQDRRALRAAPLPPVDRLRRHLGRMGAALLVATITFFIGQPRVLAGTPLEPLWLRVTPVIALAATVWYWRRRLSSRHRRARDDGEFVVHPREILRAERRQSS